LREYTHSKAGRRIGVLAGAIILVCSGCARRLPPLTGTPVPAALPRTDFPPGYRQIVFRWELEDVDFSSRGEGAARIAPPDSVRLDFFLAGGLASGAAILIGDELRLPPLGDDLARRVVPPPPLLWGALGRVALPAIADTVARVDADTLRVDIGTPVVWRLTFFRDTLRRLERVEGGRVTEWVERSSDGHVRYRNQSSRRQLDLVITRSQDAGAFDRSIWFFP
jgi:hypothetical protein